MEKRWNKSGGQQNLPSASGRRNRAELAREQANNVLAKLKLEMAKDRRRFEVDDDSIIELAQTAFVALANSLGLAIPESLIRKCDLYPWHRPGDRFSKWASGDDVMYLYLSDDRKCYAANSE